MRKSISIFLLALVIFLSIINLILTSYSILKPDFNFGTITSLLNSICILVNILMISDIKKEGK